MMNTAPPNPSNFNAQVADELVAIAETLRQSTVQIRGRRFGAGSGIIWHSDGLIITNAHVVRGARAIAELSDGRVLDARVILNDPQRDLAALVVNASNLPAATIGNSSPGRVGELVLAVGNPLGMVGALSIGIIHAVSSVGAGHRLRWLQADLRLAPGNSGGPLANVQGHVLGVNTMIAEGRAFAIPSQAVERFLASQADQPYLGVTLQPVMLPLQGQQVFGWLVLEIKADGPAEASGLAIGDVWVGIDEQLFRVPDDLTYLLSDLTPGASLQLELIRGGSRIIRQLVIGSKAPKTEAA
jgi:serine protease Do